ncbi:hypothetical protein AAVH_42821 [Aphelenchoides avenae]|nr:hypothetical protein AAVH_42821 [Aphelenchus avenae]
MTYFDTPPSEVNVALLGSTLSAYAAGVCGTSGRGSIDGGRGGDRAGGRLALESSSTISEEGRRSVGSSLMRISASVCRRIIL